MPFSPRQGGFLVDGGPVQQAWRAAFPASARGCGKTQFSVQVGEGL